MEFLTSKIDSIFVITDTVRTYTGLTNGIQRFYRITAADTNQLVSPFSNQVSATPFDTIAPAAPLNLMALAGHQKVTIKWNKNSELEKEYSTLLHSLAANESVDRILINPLIKKMLH